MSAHAAGDWTNRGTVRIARDSAQPSSFRTLSFAPSFEIVPIFCSSDRDSETILS